MNHLSCHDALICNHCDVHEDAYQCVAALLESADGLIICAGAGIGVDSQLPDYRGRDGLWRAYPALKLAGIDFHEIASPAAFATQPRLAWGFYGHRLALYRDMAPHAGFDILRRWSEALPRGPWVFTSNVDGHFQRAGFDEQRINECHGSIHYLQCTTGTACGIWPAEYFSPAVDREHAQLTSALPSCPRCGALARPNILMFKDRLWAAERQEHQERCQQQWLAGVRRPLILEIGAGTVIPSVRYFAASLAEYFEQPLVRINVREAEVEKPRDISISTGALDALYAIDRFVAPRAAERSGASSLLHAVENAFHE